MPLINDIVDMRRELTAWRHDLHAHPELGFEENRTADFVAEKLEEFGIAVHRGIGKTGVVGVLREGNEVRSVGLRADMDALPILEQNTFSHRSKTDGTMHACGHDGHTAMLLGAAKYLAKTRRFSGQVNFIFQPAEEGIGGASAMIEDGLFSKFPCDQLFAMHNAPGLPLGKFAASPGIVMGAGAFFDIEIQGTGAHGAFPHDSIDPVVITAEVVSTLQTVISRTLPPTETGVLSITQIHTGDAYNVIPAKAQLAGTARTFSVKTIARIEQKVTELVTGIARAHGAQATVDFRTVFHPTINEVTSTTLAGDVAAALVGEDNVIRNLPPSTGGEDFGYMLEQVPGCYLLLGGADETHQRPIHNPGYDFNDASAIYGASFFAQVVETALHVETD